MFKSSRSSFETTILAISGRNFGIHGTKDIPFNFSNWMRWTESRTLVRPAISLKEIAFHKRMATFFLLDLNHPTNSRNL